MLELKSVEGIVNALAWISSLGLSEVKGVKTDVEELISELSKSLVNLWEVVKTVTAIDDGEFTKEKFEGIYDYFINFYVGDWNISKARTHCGNVERTADRIKFKFVKVLHTDIGKWNEADEKLQLIVDRDGQILHEYDASISKIDSSLREIKDLLEEENSSVSQRKYFGLKKNPSVSQRKYFGLKKEMEDDIRQLKNGINAMEQAYNHINQILG
jgi:hypothetical protein